MINEEVLRTLIRDNLNRELTEDFIYDSFDIIKEGMPQVNEYLNNIYVVNGIDKNYFGSYYNKTGDVIVCIDKIRSLNLDVNLLYQFCLQIIRHEVEHAQSYAKCLEGNDDIESRVISFTYEKDLITNTIKSVISDSTSESYKCDPKERIAEIRAWEFIKKLYDYNKYSLEYVVASTFLIDACLRGYKNNKYYYEAPTYRYLDRQIIDRPYLKYDNLDLKKLVEENEYNFNTRILCGLPISNEEYNNIYNQLPARTKTRIRKQENTNFC